MTFGKRLIELRKNKGLSQTELASEIGVHKNVLGKYERDEVKPSIDTAVKVADFFAVSLDYLSGMVNERLDKDVMDKILSIQELSDEDKKHITFTLDAMLRDANARKAYS